MAYERAFMGGLLISTRVTMQFHIYIVVSKAKCPKKLIHDQEVWVFIHYLTYFILHITNLLISFTHEICGKMSSLTQWLVNLRYSPPWMDRKQFHFTVKFMLINKLKLKKDVKKICLSNKFCYSHQVELTGWIYRITWQKVNGHNELNIVVFMGKQ